jgi:oligoribonuclease
MPQDDTHLIWLDLEMTGLDPDKDRIIEIATLVTDTRLEPLAEGPVIAVYQPQEVLAGMDDWNLRHHGGSGLLDRVRASTWDEAGAEQATLAFLSAWVGPGKSPMCGNSICQDRRFLARGMPRLEAYFHYRNLDVSTLKILAQRWAPGLAEAFMKDARHQAMDDIKESIGELRHYRQHLLKV